MPQTWEASPRFTHGQVMTATAHLNALGRNILLLKDDLQGLQPMFSGTKCNEGGDGGSFSGWLLHYGGVLHWKYKVVEHNTDVTIKVNGVTRAGPTTRAPGTYAGSFSTSGIGLTVGYPYTVEVIGDPADVLYVLDLRESLDVEAFLLGSFADELVKTAGQWSGLSNYADYLARALTVPYALFPRFGTRGVFGDAYKLYGSIVHRAKYLFCNFDLKMPAWTDEGEDHVWTDLQVYINDVQYAHFRAGDETITGDRHYFKNPGGGHTAGWAEYVDLTAAALTYGEKYTIEIRVSVNGGMGWGQRADYAVVYLFHETPAGETVADPAGWQDVPVWEHGDYVRSSGAKVVSNLKDDLEILDDLLVDHGGTVCRDPIIPAGNDWQYTGMRRWRWLVYKNADNPDEPGEEMGASLGYNYKGETQHVSLPATEGFTYGVYDLDSASGLFPGTFYTVGGVKFAFERAEA